MTELLKGGPDLIISIDMSDGITTVTGSRPDISVSVSRKNSNDLHLENDMIHETIHVLVDSLREFMEKINDVTKDPVYDDDDDDVQGELSEFLASLFDTLGADVDRSELPVEELQRCGCKDCQAELDRRGYQKMTAEEREANGYQADGNGKVKVIVPDVGRWLMGRNKPDA